MHSILYHVIDKKNCLDRYLIFKIKKKCITLNIRYKKREKIRSPLNISRTKNKQKAKKNAPTVTKVRVLWFDALEHC